MGTEDEDIHLAHKFCPPEDIHYGEGCLMD